MKRFSFVCLFALLSIAPAAAKPHQGSEIMDRDGRVYLLRQQPPEPIHRYRFERAKRQYVNHKKTSPHQIARAAVEGAAVVPAQVVGSRPAGCPSAFCGCGVSLHIFGRIVANLNLAANWFHFPRAAPAAGMVAVRNHHVFAIERVIDDNHVVAYDPNSGGHLTRIHVRSLAGYTVVNPHGGKG